MVEASEVKPRLLNGCAKSKFIADAFEAKGWEAWTCDILPAEGPGNHIQDEVLKHLDDGWDMAIFHPPCTHLSKAGGWCWKFKVKEQQAALKFVMALMESPIALIAIENPVGAINTFIRPPDQIIHPYYFGDPWLKETCLWLKNLPKLTYVLHDDMFYHATAVEPKGNWVKPGNVRPRRFNQVPEGGNRNSEDRSRTFPAIAQAMAEQWGNLVIAPRDIEWRLR
jgi:hypothetical protein